ncbi:ATP-binding protein [Schaedlerella arabinosiphila]|uniref:ATP-binding protein n=1 Tax=Schaedlerella arabinosiphila TaxID=2044587 RepID=A0A426DCZ2_9FIRM|nr:ATP-binding protein [Schaedlerella arabinosiphila]RRK30598.1 ATP-binding protein [Schaedlerella arabinosiphila]
MHKRIERPEYLEQLIRFREKEVIKVVTGIRRCGKSTLFDLYCEYLVQDGVSKDQIIRVNMEDPDYHDIRDYMQLYDWIRQQMHSEKMNYILIDEVQNVPEFQKAVDGLYIKENCDVYITGSNAYLLSGELATLLAGRYVEIKMLPLSFKEYLSALEDKTDLMLKYQNYIQNGSFPYVVQLEKKRDIHAYLEGIYTSIILKDIMARYRIADAGGLDSVIRFMFDNVGNLCSATKIANTMTTAGRKIAISTVENYLGALTECFILYKAGRYDVKGKQYLTTGNKYYLCDMGLRYYLLGTKRADLGHILENVVYLELLRRGYEVYIGKVGIAEIDFIAIGEEGEEYYQVALTVMEESTLERELAPLESIRDHNPKYLLTMDFTPLTSHNGIKQWNVLEWLMK